MMNLNEISEAITDVIKDDVYNDSLNVDIVYEEDEEEFEEEEVLPIPRGRESGGGGVFGFELIFLESETQVLAIHISPYTDRRMAKGSVLRTAYKKTVIGLVKNASGLLGTITL